MGEEEGSPRGRDSEELQKTPPKLSLETPQTPTTERVSKPVNEESPLLSPSEEEGPLMEDNTVLADDPHKDFQETKSLWYMVLLTISIGGLQLAWAVELSNGTPYLLSLGLSKSLMALVWIAGPLSGALVQPYVGMLSDNCRSKWGKRVPFMAAGAAATIISLLALAWVREIVGGFLGIFGADRESKGVRVTIIVVAVIFVYLLDFAINTGMNSARLRELDTDLLQCKLELELSFWTAVQAISRRLQILWQAELQALAISLDMLQDT